MIEQRKIVRANRYSSKLFTKAYSDPASSKYYAGMGLHWYFDSAAPALSMSAVHAAYPDKFILYTEVLPIIRVLHHI